MAILDRIPAPLERPRMDRPTSPAPESEPPPSGRHLPVVFKLALLIGGVLGAACLGLFLLFAQSEAGDLQRLMLKQAKTLHRQIVLTRQWNSSHGGVYTIKRPGEVTNPFLYIVGPAKIRPEISDQDGNVYTLKSSSLMTRELAELTRRDGLTRYRLTSLAPLNPENAPDTFEAEALRSFEAGGQESSEVTTDREEPLFRFIAPLAVTQDCQGCHGFQGYQLGDIIGGVSLVLPMATEVALFRDRERLVLMTGALLIVLLALTLALGSSILITRPLETLRRHARDHLSGPVPVPEFILKRQDEIGDLARDLNEARREIGGYRRGLEGLAARRSEEIEDLRKQLEEVSRTDPLTGLGNRRHLELDIDRVLAQAQREQTATTVMLLDLDHFKAFNDRYGHAAGDTALAQVSGVLKNLVRPYDLAVRYGGEVFLLVMPGCGREEGRRVAERIRRHVAKANLEIDGGTVALTISIGVCTAPGSQGFEQLLNEAQAALQRAKQDGRNQVVLAATSEATDSPDEFPPSSDT